MGNPASPQVLFGSRPAKGIMTTAYGRRITLAEQVAGGLVGGGCTLAPGSCRRERPGQLA